MVRVMILGLLGWRPMSGYEIQQLLQMSRVDQWSDVLPGSIYHGLKKLTNEGLVELSSTEHTGMRTKAVYAITEAGRAEYQRLLREAWNELPRSLPGDFYLLLTFVDDLPRAEVLGALQRQIGDLETRLAQWEAGRVAKAEAMGGLSPLVEAMFANGREHMEADLAFLRRLAENLPRMDPVVRTIPTMED